MTFKKMLLCAAGGLSTVLVAAPAQAQSTFLGQIIETPYNFCPRGFTETNGQILSISQNTALFSLLGTTYGGNGQTNFALPDLRGREAIEVGQGPGLEDQALGEIAGSETITLTVNQLPIHNHVANLLGVSALPDDEKVKKASLATFPVNTQHYNRTLAPDTAMAAGSVTTDNAGGGQPFANRDPYLALRFCIATEGIFPSRN